MSVDKKFVNNLNKYGEAGGTLGGKKVLKTVDMEDGSIYMFNKTTNRFEVIIMPSGADVMFRDSRPIPATIGGWTKGDVINNIPLSEVVRTLLYPYEAPAFSSFFLSGAPVLEIGDILTTATFNWSITNTTNTVANSISIFRGSSPILTGANNSPVNMELNIQNNMPKQEIFKIVATNSKGAQFYMTTSVNWNIPVYYGVSMNKTVVEDEVEAMSSILCNTLGSYTFPLQSPGYKYIAIPTSFINRSLIFKDADTKYDVPMIEVNTIDITHDKSGLVNNYTLYRSFYLLNGGVNINIT